MHEWWIFDTYVRLRDRVESISPRKNLTRNDTTILETHQILNILKRSFHVEALRLCVVFWGPKKKLLAHRNHNPRGSNDPTCHGELQAIGSGFSDTICPLTTLGLGDLYSTNLWLVSFFFVRISTNSICQTNSFSVVKLVTKNDISHGVGSLNLLMNMYLYLVKL